MIFRSLIWLVFIFCAAVALALLGHLDQGYIVLVYPPYSVRFTLGWAILGLAISIFIAVVLIRIAKQIFGIPNRVSAYIERSRAQKALRELCNALNHIMSGQFAKAEKAAERTIKFAGVTPTMPSAHRVWRTGGPQDSRSMSVIQRRKLHLDKQPTRRLIASNTLIQIDAAANLLGAMAAHELNQPERRDLWLDAISAEEWQEARYLSEANWLADSDENRAQQALNRFYEEGAQSRVADRLAMRIAELKHDWPAVRYQIKLLEKNKAIDSISAMRLKTHANEQLLAGQQHSAQALQAIWKELDNDEQLQPTVAERCARQWIALNEYTQARKIIETALSENWNGELVRLYRLCAENNDQTHLLMQRAEQWLIDHDNDIDLLYTLGYLCVKQQLWGKARAFLEQALQLANNDKQMQQRLHQLLAEMHESVNDSDQANQHYRASAQVAKEIDQAIQPNSTSE